MVAGKKLIIFCPMSNMNSGKPKCLACSRTIAINHRAVPCGVCKRKTHMTCSDIAPRMYDQMITGTNLQWTCPGLLPSECW